MNVMIIGGTGFLGNFLCKELRKQGHTVKYTGRDVRSDDGYIRCDIRRDRLDIPNNTDVIYYLAQAENCGQFPYTAADILGVNTYGAVKVAAAAEKNGCKAFFYASTANVYAPSFVSQTEDCPLDRSNLYALSKVQAEEALWFMANGGMKICCLRIFGLYGSMQTKKLAARLLKRIAQGNPIYLFPTQKEKRSGNEYTTGGLKISWLCVHDAVTQLVALAQRISSGKNIPFYLNLAGPRSLSLLEFTRLMGYYLGIDPQYEIKKEHRTRDFIADVNLVGKLLSPSYTSHDEAVRVFVKSVNIELIT